MKHPPVFDLVIGTHSSACRVRVNGRDISRLLKGFRIDATAGKLTSATLLVRDGAARATVQAAIEDVTVEGGEGEAPTS